MQAAEGMVVATTFASNVARLRTLAQAGKAAGREVVVLGRAMNTMLRTAHAAEVLDGLSRDARPARRRQRAAAEPPGARHRQPGRAAGGHGAARPGQVPRLRAPGRRHLPLLVEDHPRQRGGGGAHPQPAEREGGDGRRRQRRALPRLRTRQPAGPRGAAGAGAAADAGADARRAPASRGARGAGARARHRGGGGAERDAGRPDRGRAAARREGGDRVGSISTGPS